MIQLETSNFTIFESALYRTTSTLFYNDDLVLLVDPNWLPAEIEAIKRKVVEVQGDRPLYLLFTHSDYDHIIAWNAFPDATTIVSRAFVENKNWKKCIDEIIEFDQTYYVQRDYPIAYPKGDYIIEADGQQLQIGSTQLTFYLAPGHNIDGIFTIVEPAGLWIAGDYLSNIEFPFIYYSSEAYEATLQKVDPILENHDIQWLITGHGDCTSEVAEIKKRKVENLAYINGLRATIKEGQSLEGADILWQHYPFKRGQSDFHNKNIKLIKGELGE